MLLCIVDHPTRIEPDLWCAMVRAGDCQPLVWHLEERPAGADSGGYQQQHVPAKALGKALRSLEPRPAAILLAGIRLPLMRKLLVVAGALRIPMILVEDKTLNEPSPSGPLGVADALFHAGKVRLFAGFMTTGLLGTQYLVSLGCPRERIVAGSAPVDVAAWQARKQRSAAAAPELQPQLRHGARVILSVAPGSADAGALVLLDAFSRVQREQPDVFLVLAVDAAQRGKIEARARDLRCHDHLRILTDLDREGLAPYYAAARLVAHTPVKHQWGAPILDAMACERPVVATTTASVAGDVLVHGRNGALCQPGDANDTAQALQLLLRRLSDDAAGVNRRALEAARRFDVLLAAQQLALLVQRVAQSSWQPPPLAATLFASTKNEFGRWSL